jgi:hypothetical protein
MSDLKRILALCPAVVLGAGPLLAESLPCGRVRISESRPVQGTTVLVEVDGKLGAPPPRVTWEGQALLFWPGAGGGHRALLGVDVESPPGSFPLELSYDGRAGCSTPVEVRDGRFPVERLTLPRHLVELGPEDLARALGDKERLEAIFSASSRERLWRGPLRFPVDGIEPRRNFGRRRILNGEPRSPHSGVDFPAPRGTPVRAIGRGRVVLIDSLFFTGRTVVLDHGLGLYSLYAHLSSVSAEEDRVLAGGAVLGQVGATGRATGPHLHLSVRAGMARVDPLGLLALFGEESWGHDRN